MSPFSRRAIAVFTVVMCALIFPGAYTAADESDSYGGSQASAEASPSPEPSPEPTPSATPDEPEPSPSPSPSDPSPAPSPSSTPTPTPSPDEPGLGAQGEEEESPLHLSLGAAPATIELGQETTIGVVLTNPNDAPARDVDVTVTLPREIGFLSSTPTPDSVTSSGQRTIVSFTGIDVPAQGWSTLAITAEGVEETKRPSTIDARALWQGFEPSETATINVVVPPSELSLTTRGPGLLSTVGEIVEYEITLRNVGDAPLFDVAIVNLVPSEVHVISTGLAPGIDAVQVGNSGNAEDIVWTMDEMDPGEVVRVTYRGVVEKPGDLEALNRTRALAGNTEEAEESERSYLATSAGGDSENPSFEPIVDRRVVTEKVVERPLIRRRLPTEPGGVPSTAALPFTGLDPWGIAATGIMLIGLGLMFVRFGARDFDRRRVFAVAFLLLLIGGACISSDSERDEAGDTRVKGRQIERDDAPGDGEDTPQDDSPSDDDRTDDDNDGNGSAQPDDDANAGEADDPAPEGDAGDDDGSPVAVEPEEPETEEVLVPGPPVTSFERRVVTTTLTQDELGIARIASITNADSASFNWNDAASSGSGTASSRHDVVEMTTSVAPSGPGMRATVTLTNISDRTRAEVAGRLDLVVSSSGGRSLATLTGETVDVVLNPGGETTASFTFRLPTGAYSATGIFRSH